MIWKKHILCRPTYIGTFEKSVCNWRLNINPPIHWLFSIIFWYQRMSKISIKLAFLDHNLKHLDNEGLIILYHVLFVSYNFRLLTILTLRAILINQQSFYLSLFSSPSLSLLWLPSLWWFPIKTYSIDLTLLSGMMNLVLLKQLSLIRFSCRIGPNHASQFDQIPNEFTSCTKCIS